MVALREAAARGVHVRVLVDGMNARLNLQGSAALQELAAAENVEVRLYNPVDLLRPGEINYRMHDKYILVDGSLCLLGGRNTNDRFLSRTGQARTTTAMCWSTRRSRMNTAPCGSWRTILPPSGRSRRRAL